MESEIVGGGAHVVALVTRETLARVLRHLVPFQAGQLGRLVRALVTIKNFAGFHNRRSDSLVLGHLVPDKRILTSQSQRAGPNLQN